jgi:hypothetical protein
VDRRRFLLTSLAGALATPLAAGAQQTGKVYQVGYVSLGGRPTQSGIWQNLLEAMRELNYVEGQNLIVRLSLAEGKPERLPGLVDELGQAKVDVIVTTSTQETLAAKQATSTIPIVMTLVPDPVEQGLVASFARPGSNVTGLTDTAPGTSQKLVELLREAVPSASRLGVLRTGANSPFPEVRAPLPAVARHRARAADGAPRVRLLVRPWAGRRGERSARSSRLSRGEHGAGQWIAVFGHGGHQPVAPAGTAQAATPWTAVERGGVGSFSSVQ